MPTVLAVAHLPHVSGIPADEVQNSFVFASAALSVVDMHASLNGSNTVDGFYNDAVGQSRAIGAYMSDVLDRAANKCSIEYYDITLALDGSPHGSPFAIDTFTLAAPPVNTQSLPAEVAAVMTLYGTGRDTAAVEAGPTDIPNTSREIAHGAPATHVGNSRPKQSRTGRLYVGPLNVLAMSGITTEPRLDATFQGDLRNAGYNIPDNTGDPDIFWAVWSRKNAATYAIFGGHVDNAFDTQRRRGVKSTLRLSFAL